MPNPAGVNQFQGFSQAGDSPQQGEVKRLQQLTKDAPMSGAPTPGMGAPRNAQRAATRGASRKAAAPADLPPEFVGPPAPASLPIAQVWQELAANPEADDLVREYAQRAAGMAAGG